MAALAEFGSALLLDPAQSLLGDALSFGTLSPDDYARQVIVAPLRFLLRQRDGDAGEPGAVDGGLVDEGRRAWHFPGSIRNVPAWAAPVAALSPRVVWALTHVADRSGDHPIDATAFPVEELGFLYEALAALRGYVDRLASPPFRLMPDVERRRYGAYYTPMDLARVLAEQTIGPLLDERSALSGSMEAAILGLRVCDPACGCGNFLLAAARYLGRRLAMARRVRADPTSDQVRQATRDVIACCLYGVDRDPFAADLCRALLSLEAGRTEALVPDLDRRIRRGNSLSPNLDWRGAFEEVFAGGGFDVVLGNPPFGNAIEGTTARNTDEARSFKELFPEITRGAYDRSSLFLGLAPRLLRPRGMYGLVCPRSTASGRGGQAVRAYLAATAPPRLLWCPDGAGLFGAARVFVCVVAGRLGPPPTTMRVSTDPDPATARFREIAYPASAPPTWWALVDEGADASGEIVLSGVPLARLAEARAGCTTAVAYDLVGHIADAETEGGLKLVTTGAIDRFNLRWGQINTRFLGHDFRFPRWPEHLDGRVGRSRDRQRRRKILVGGLSRVVEATYDRTGDAAGVVSTHLVVPRLDGAPLSENGASEPQDESFSRVLCVLNSAAFSHGYFRAYGGKQLSGGNCTIGKTELLNVLVPADLLADGVVSDAILPGWTAVLPDLSLDRRRYWEEAVTLAERLSADASDAEWPERDARLHAIVSALYGLHPSEHDAVYRWWRARIRRVTRRSTRMSADKP